MAFISPGSWRFGVPDMDPYANQLYPKMDPAELARAKALLQSATPFDATFYGGPYISSGTFSSTPTPPPMDCPFTAGQVLEMREDGDVDGDQKKGNQCVVTQVRGNTIDVYWVSGKDTADFFGGSRRGTWFISNRNWHRLLPTSLPNPMPPAKFKAGEKVCFTKEIQESGRTFAAGTVFTLRAWSADGFVAEDDLLDEDGRCAAWSFTYLHKDHVVSFAEWDKSRPKVSLDTVVMTDDKKEQIRAAISQLSHHDTIFNKWGFAEVFEKGTAISLLFYGPPGTGKTLAAQAIAESLGLKLKLIQTAEIESSEPGQAERNIKEFFKNAVKKKELLLFDECDSLINDRNEVGMILGAQINALLTALEQYTGVVVFTTNRLGKMDPAMQRRISATIEFEFPNEGQRMEIWKRLLPTKAPLSKNVDLAMLAKFPIAGGNIKNAILSAARMAAYKGKTEIDEECFEHGIEKEVRGLKSFEGAYRQQKKLPHAMGPGGRGSADIERGAGGLEIKRDKVAKMEIEEELDIASSPSST